MDSNQKNKGICPCCHAELEMPKQFLDAMKRLSDETGKFIDVAILDFCLNDLVPVLFPFIESHQKLFQELYCKDGNVNSNHPAHEAETQMITFLEENGLLAKYFSGDWK